MADYKTKKQVVLVVEGTAALCPYWPTILEDHLNDLIRSFCDNGSSSEDDAYNPNIEFAFVVFNARGSLNSTWLLHQSNWTNNVNCLRKWLSAIDFGSDTSFSDAATAKGLAQALTMFRSSNESQNDSLQRHCILIAASNPDSPDAEKVAKLFPQSNVSLLVVNPLKLPKLGAICNAGKHNPSVASKSKMRSISELNYVKVWEGDLYGVPLGKRILLTRLQAYLNSSASKLVKDWPSSIQIRTITQSNVATLQKKYAEKAYFVLFHAMYSPELLQKLQKRKLCGVIKLPSQIVLFTVSNNPSCFLGMIFNFTPEQQQILFKKYGWDRNESIFRRRSTHHGQVSSTGP